MVKCAHSCMQNIQNKSGHLRLVGEKFVAVDAAAAHLLGYASHESLIGKSPIDFSSAYQPTGEHSATKARKLIHAARSGQPQQFEWWHRHQQGYLIPLMVTLSPASEGAIDVTWTPMTHMHDTGVLQSTLHTTQQYVSKLAQVHEIYQSPIRSRSDFFAYLLDKLTYYTHSSSG